MAFTFKTFLVIALLVLCVPVYAQFVVPQLNWQHCYGGTELENSALFTVPHDHMMIHTADGGYAFVAQANSYDGDVVGNHHDTTPNPTFDIWLVKISASGQIQWQKCFGGSRDEEPTCLIQTSDGGFALCGSTKSHDGDVTDNDTDGTISDIMYTRNGWIVKTDASGNNEWAHCYGWSHGDEILNSIIEAEGGYVAVGSSTTVEEAPEGHVLDSKTNQGDAYIVKVNAEGKEIWHKLYGGLFKDYANAVVPFPSGGYLYIGMKGGQGPFAGGWMVKLDTAGQIVWEKGIGGSTIIAVPDGYMVAGGPGVSIIDTAGTALRGKAFAGSFGLNYINSVVRTSDGNYVFAGSSNSGDIPGSHQPDPLEVPAEVDSTDAWVGCFSPDMKLLWQHCYGGEFRESFYTVLENADHTIMCYGSAETGSLMMENNGDISGIRGYADAWLVNIKLAQRGVRESSSSVAVAPYPNPAATNVYLDLDNGASVRHVELFDPLGAEVYPTYHVESTTLVANVRELPPGIYVIKVTYSNGTERIAKFRHARD